MLELYKKCMVMISSFCMKVILPILLIQHDMKIVGGDYILRVQTIVFTINSESLSACDVPPNEGCDSEFFYCVRPLGTNVTPPVPTTATAPGVFIDERTIAMLQCLQPPGAVRSDVNNISASVDFTSAALLGQPNPLEFKVIATKWEGIQFYVDVIVSDFPDTGMLIDIIAIDIEPSTTAGFNKTASQTGVLEAARLELSFNLECLPGFVGETCTKDTCLGVNCNTGCNIGGIVGGAVGGVSVLFIIIFIVSVVVCIVVVHVRHPRSAAHKDIEVVAVRGNHQSRYALYSDSDRRSNLYASGNTTFMEPQGFEEVRTLAEGSIEQLLTKETEVKVEANRAASPVSLEDDQDEDQDEYEIMTAPNRPYIAESTSEYVSVTASSRTEEIYDYVND